MRYLDNNIVVLTKNDEGTASLAKIHVRPVQASQQINRSSGPRARSQGKGVRQIPKILHKGTPRTRRKVNAQFLNPPARPSHPRKKWGISHQTQI